MSASSFCWVCCSPVSLIPSSLCHAQECRHATIRRLAVATSVQSWVASFERVSAEWSVRQVLQQQQQFTQAKPGKRSQGEKQARNQSGKPEKVGRAGGFGGAWRAFVHLNHAGRRFSKASLKALGNEYRGLSAEEQAFYKDLGSKAVLASRAGFKSFGEKVRQAEDQQAVLAGAAAEAGALVPVSPGICPASETSYRDLVPNCSVNFDKALRSLRKSLRQQAARARQEVQRREEKRLQKQEEVLSTLSQVVAGVPAQRSSLALRKNGDQVEVANVDVASDDGSDVATDEPSLPARGDVLAVSWCPPSVDLAKAGLRAKAKA